LELKRSLEVDVRVYRDLSSQPANSNVDFQAPLQFQAPFSARVMAKWEF